MRQGETPKGKLGIPSHPTFCLFLRVSSTEIFRTIKPLDAVTEGSPSLSKSTSASHGDISFGEVSTKAPTTLTMAGFAELTAFNSALFQETVCVVLNGQAVVEIDLSRTTFIDCAGLGALIAVRNLIRLREGVVRLVNPSSCVQQVLDLARARQIFEIVHNWPAARP